MMYAITSYNSTSLNAFTSARKLAGGDTPWHDTVAVFGK
jgi:hypothetical protein